MTDPHESADPLIRLEMLADFVRGELTVAGLPVVPDSLHGGSPIGAAGAHVFADNLEHRGVFVGWANHHILRSAALEAWSEGRKGSDNPAGELMKTIAIAMRDAMFT